MTVDIRIAASVETFARWQLAADRARFPLHEWILEYLNVASDPDAGQVVDVVESLNRRLVVAEANAESRQARVAALEAALREIADYPHQSATTAEHFQARARAALAVSGNQPQ